MDSRTRNWAEDVTRLRWPRRVAIRREASRSPDVVPAESNRRTALGAVAAGLAGVVGVAVILGGCSAVFSATVAGAVFDEELFVRNQLYPLANLQVFLYESEAARSDDSDRLTDSNPDTTADAYFARTVTGADGFFQMQYVWENFFPEYGDTADREEVFLLFHDASGEYPTTEEDATLTSDGTADVRVFVTAERARANVGGLVGVAGTGTPPTALPGVTVTGYLPSSWEYAAGGEVGSIVWGGERAFRTTTGEDGTYQASFTFPKSPVSDGEEQRIRLALVFTMADYVAAPAADDDLLPPADIDGDGDAEVYYETPVVVENRLGVTTLDTIVLALES